MTSTASSESELSSSELQALKEDNENVKIGDQRVVFASPGKVDKRPSQKVPKLSSKKLAQIHVKVHVHVHICVCVYVCVCVCAVDIRHCTCTCSMQQ